MDTASSAEITRLLRAWGGGDQAAMEELAPLVYGELRRMAHRYLRRENPGNTLQPTALVNEAYLRLVDVSSVRWEDRAHFFAVSQMMRRILVDAARPRCRQARRRRRTPQSERVDRCYPDRAANVALDEALDSLPSSIRARRVDKASSAASPWRNRRGPQDLRPASCGLKLARAWLMRELSG
jgi:RNA polymerase sigma factor (TIGR02999 family)